jgi:hypothetical protein
VARDDQQQPRDQLGGEHDQRLRRTGRKAAKAVLKETGSRSIRDATR